MSESTISNSTKLRVIIIGSGLSGLAAARVVREHHDVIIYERASRDVASGGQGIALNPNAIRILESIGFNIDRAGGVRSSGYQSYDKDGHKRTEYEVDFVARYGADVVTFKRSDFRHELLRLATATADELNIPVNPVKAVYNNGVTGINPQEGTVMLSDGSKDKGDVVIVADGIHSQLRNCVIGTDQYRPKKMGATCFRVAISTYKAKEALGQLPDWWSLPGAKNRASMIESRDGSHRFIVAYPLCHGQYMNLSFVFPTTQDRASTKDSWYADADRGEVLEVFKDFYDPIPKLIQVAEEVKMWDLQDIDTLPTFTAGKTLLIGDAAHAMTPMQGQGGNMAVEDAEALRLLTPELRAYDVVPVLKQIEGIRKPRAAQVLQDTRAISEEMSLENSISKMDYNMSYKGIYDALEKAGIALNST